MAKFSNNNTQYNNTHIGYCRPEEARLLWRRSTAAFDASSHPGVRHAALRCAGAVLGRLRRLHAGTPGETSPESSAADALATDGAATSGAAAATMTSATAAGAASLEDAPAAAGSDEATGSGGDSLALLDAAAGWLLEAAEGGAGPGEAPELRLAVADAIAAAGRILCRGVMLCSILASSSGVDAGLHP